MSNTLKNTAGLTIGTRLRLKNNGGKTSAYGHIPNGSIATVVGFSKAYPEALVIVKFDVGDTLEMFARRFSLADEQFRVGDVVDLINSDGLTIGTRLRLDDNGGQPGPYSHIPNGSIATVVGFYKVEQRRFVSVKFDGGDTLDMLARRFSLADEQFLAIPAAPKAVAAPKRPTAPMTKAVLDLLKKKGSTTALEAHGVIRCRSLSKRICELKSLGHNIVAEYKLDPTGQRYARYHLMAA